MLLARVNSVLLAEASTLDILVGIFVLVFLLVLLVSLPIYLYLDQRAKRKLRELRAAEALSNTPGVRTCPTCGNPMIYGAMRGSYEDASEWTPAFRYLCQKCNDNEHQRVSEWSANDVASLVASGKAYIAEPSDEALARRARGVRDKEMKRRHAQGLCINCGKRLDFLSRLLVATIHSGCAVFTLLCPHCNGQLSLSKIPLDPRVGYTCPHCSKTEWW